MTQPDHHVVIIGAGVSGIGMAVALRRAGLHDFVLLERARDIGGTWRDNTYPGIAVDVPAQAYQFSFALNPGWSRVFAPGAEVQNYLRGVAERFGVRAHVRFGCEVAARTWDESARLWRLSVGDREVTARFVISAIGAFVDPEPPRVPGLEDFAGTVMHSSRWDHDVDLAGARVAVVGTGSSAVQIVPEIADEVRSLDVYQRTPVWVAPKPDLPTPAPVRALFRAVPSVQQLVRRISARAGEALLVDVVLGYRRVSPVITRVSRVLRDLWYRIQVPDPRLRADLTPGYVLGCKRPAVSNDYLRTFTRDHVELVTDPIETFTPTGLRTRDGTHREVDVVVLATGFRLASDPENYRRTPVRGRDGFDLAENYQRDRLSSYQGISMPGLPNHFIMFGPYGWVGGTWYQMVESTAAHVVRVLTEARRRDATVVEVAPGPTRRWTGRMQDRMSRSLFADPSCATANSYYIDHHGDFPYLRPTSSKAAFRAAATFPIDDYRFTGPGETRPDPAAVTEAVRS